VVLPFFGPRTLRDAAAMPADMAGSGLMHIDHVRTRNQVIVLRTVHGRSTLLGVDRTLDDQLDKYAFMRDAYLQRRRYEVHDGNPPIDYEDFDLDEQASKPLLYETLPDAVALAAISGFEFVDPFAVDRKRIGPIAGVVK
jgi:phospholipid-binding lipoprotein MlaA